MFSPIALAGNLFSEKIVSIEGFCQTLGAL